ncbi:MAG: chorismate synthase, partial [Erysipelotrichaceae bacterium]|nr:chorismate synthase [Erysipelotrichaceae bacterium]
MKNTFGNAFQVTIFGESHGDGIGIIIDGLPAGIALDFAFIQQQIKKRQPKEKISTKRHEEDAIEIVSGFFENHTTGSPLCILIKNNQHNSKDYEALGYVLGPSHADY